MKVLKHDKKAQYHGSSNNKGPTITSVGLHEVWYYVNIELPLPTISNLILIPNSDGSLE